MKTSTILGKSLALGLMMVLLLASGCTTTVTVTPVITVNPQGGITLGATIRVTIQNLTNNFGSGQYVAIFDSAKQWQPTANGSPTLEVTISPDGAARITAEFDIALDSGLSQQIDAVDKDTVPYAYVITDQAAFASFLDSNLSGQTSGDFEARFVIPIEQVDCSTTSGKYVNHVRFQDSSGITYVDSFHYLYVEPSSGGNCMGGELSIAP